MKRTSSLLKWAIKIGLFVSFFILFYFVVALLTHGVHPLCPFGGDGKVDGALTGQTGDFIGGVVGTILSLSSIFLLILTLREQQTENRKDSFEQTLSSMIDRYNSITLAIQYKKSDGSLTFGRDAIALLLDDFMNILEEVLPCVDCQLSNNKEIRAHFDQNTTKLFAQKLAFGYFMYGYKNYYTTREKVSPEHELNLSVTAAITVKAESNLGLWSTQRSSQLGHYFRCIFNIVKFVASQDWLSENEKYQYVKQLRSLMSDKEQVLLYYNALSALGEPWIRPLGEDKVENMCYMARFRMIKNIPYYFQYLGVNPKKLFIKEVNVYDKLGKKFFEIDLESQSSYLFLAFASKRQ